MNNNSYIISFKVSCLTMIILAWSTMASAISLSIIPTSQSIGPTDTADVAVVISGLGNQSPDSLGTFDLELTYDPTILTYQSTSFGDTVLGDQLDLFGLGSISDVTPGSNAVEVYEVSLDSVADLDSLQAGSFQLATLTFMANAMGTSSLGINVIDLGDANGNPLSASVINGGSVTVTAVPIPAAVWLLGSGLLGLVGVSRHKKSN